MRRVPRWLRERIRRVTAKRPRVVLDHILKHGQVTTQDLRDTYGYNHPPRAARDVREHGIPLETFRVRGQDGRMIAAYRFPVTAQVRGKPRRGRRAFPKAFKQQLLKRYGARCHICDAELEPRYLQIDHRVPYEIARDEPSRQLRVRDYMLLCTECNRGKSWSCESCPNRHGAKRVGVCRSCYWARPERYQHIATVPHRRLVISWQGSEEVERFAQLVEQARASGVSRAEFARRVIVSSLEAQRARQSNRATASPARTEPRAPSASRAARDT